MGLWSSIFPMIDQGDDTFGYAAFPNLAYLLKCGIRNTERAAFHRLVVDPWATFGG